MLLIWNLIFVLLVYCVLAYHRIGLKLSSLFLLLALGLCALYDFHTIPSGGHLHILEYIGKIIILGFIAMIICMMNISELRSRWVSRKIFDKYLKVMPKISSTERQALEAGTVNWARELFNGKPNWKILRSVPIPELSNEERAFLEGPVEELCAKINDWQITQYDFDMPKEVWHFIKENGFFGLIIPKQYGGKEFSPYAHSQIVSKLYGVSSTVGTTVSVPNSLGPAELLLHYGTEDQKNYYLPRLAKGEEVPCFALTAPEAGSDAASITDSGVICKGVFNQREIIGIRLNWSKRYITLAPCATVMGLAFKLNDPDKLISNKTDYGITCALIPVNLPGITIGRRHLPMSSAFMNGPIHGKDVFVPLEMIIGGMAMAGLGWKMLLECLSVGRAISLPSTAMGGAKMAVFATGAYAHIRKQFHLPIGKFEGISEPLSRMAGQLYLMLAASEFTYSLINQGDRPAILSSIMKYHITEMGRKIACDAMDVHGGKAIFQGPKNPLGKFYQTIPIAITVEGANILNAMFDDFWPGRSALP